MASDAQPVADMDLKRVVRAYVAETKVPAFRLDRKPAAEADGRQDDVSGELKGRISPIFGAGPLDFRHGQENRVTRGGAYETGTCDKSE